MKLKYLKLFEDFSAFNDAGEPIMTHKQYLDYSEPSEDDYDEYVHNDNEYVNFKKSLIQDMKNKDIFVETFDDEKYFIRCKGNEDFLLYIHSDDIDIYYHTETETIKKEGLTYEEAIDYILENKDKFQSYEESVRDRNREFEIEASDRRNNRMEMGGYGS